MSTIFQNVRLVQEVSDNVPFQMADVVIEGNCITAVEPAGKVPVKAGDVAVNGSGKTMLPGLYDIHQHSDAMSVNFLDNWKIRDPFDFVNQSCLWSMRMLKMGYTTMRCMGSADYLGVKVRNVIDAGIFNGPRLLASGNGLAGTTASTLNNNPTYDGADAWLRGAREHIGRGVDFLKIFVSGSVMSNMGHPGQLVVTPEEVNAAVKGALARGVYTAAHAHSAESIKLCLDAGVRTIEHATWCNAELRKQVKDKNDHQFLVPTLAVQQWCAGIAETDDPELLYLAKRAAMVIGSCKENIGSAYAEGILMGWGTDLDVESLEKEPGQEFRLRKEWCGMSNIEMIKQATMYSAQILELGHISGQIKVGYEADLVLYDGNPDEDITVFNQYPAVYKRGKLVE